MESGHDVGDVAFLDLHTLVVQGEAIGLHVVKPHLIRAAVACLGEHQHRRGHPGVGLEHPRGHRDHRLQPVALHDLLADVLMSLGGTEQHPVGYDDGAPPAYLQHPQEEGQEQQLGLLGLANLQQVGGHDVRVQAPLEGGIGQNEGVLLPVGVLVAEAVPILNVGVVDAVGHHVHGPDAQHSAVHIVAVEHMVHVMVFLLTVEEDFFFPVLLQILAGRHQEAAGAAGRVADHVVRLGGGELHHHADDVPGGAELAVHPGTSSA